MAVLCFGVLRRKPDQAVSRRIEPTGALPPDVEHFAKFNDFVRDVLRQAKRTGRVSPKQAEAVRAAISRIKEAQAATPHLGIVGQDVTVEGEVMKVDYWGMGKNRCGRYVIAAPAANVIYEGPAVLVGRLGEVRFTATVRAHEYSGAGHCDTVVENVRDVAILRRPRENYRSKPE